MRVTAVVLIIGLVPVAGPGAQRVRFGPGVCGPMDPSYVKVATDTGGQPFPLSTTEAGTSTRAMAPSSMRDMILWASSDREQSYAIPVDSTVQRLMFSGTFNGTGGSLTLVAPDGAVVRQSDGVDDTPLNCGRIVTVSAPATGIWQARVTPTGRFWFVVHAKSDVSLSGAEFVEARSGDPDRVVRIQGQPVAALPATLRVRVSETFGAPTFHLVTLEGRPLRTVDLRSMGDGEFIGTITLPADAFRVLASGHDSAGAATQRIWAGVFHAEHVEVIPPADETVTAGTDTPFTFTIRDHGDAVRVRLLAVDHRGKVIAVDPPELDLAAASDSIAIVRLTVPADASEGSTVGIRVTATIDPKAPVGGFNSAGRTLTVIRE